MDEHKMRGQILAMPKLLLHTEQSVPQVENKTGDGSPKMNAKIVSIVDDTIFLAHTFSVRTCQALSLINF